jgi:hypothetical protein
MDTRHAESELALIKQMMLDSRRVIADNGWHYTFWGIVVTVTLIANYVMALMNLSMRTAGLMWFAAMISAAIIDGIIGRRESKKRRVSTFAGSLLSSLWMASGISMFMLGFVGTLSGAYNPIYICSLISIVLSVAYFTSGAIQQIKWLNFLAGGRVLFTLLFSWRSYFADICSYDGLLQIIPHDTLQK